MADPRRFIYNPLVRPTTFSVKPQSQCPDSLLAAGKQSAARKSFFGELTGKLGGIEGLGKVGEGLRTLSKVSNLIRLGQGAGLIPSDAGLDDGVKYVMDKVGIDHNAATKVIGSFNPDVLNRAVGQAKSVYKKVTKGKFEIDQIPGVITDFQHLYDLTTSIFTPSDQPEQREYQLCGASPYARDLIAYAPKYKFMFVVQIIFNSPYDAWSGISADLAFVVKNSSRPNVSFEYEEVNMYNFWTKIPKRTVYEPMTMRFYDDNQNNANLFYTAYLRAMSPISNIPDHYSVDQYQQESMKTAREQTAIPGSHVSQGGTFGEQAPPIANSTASLGPLANGNVTIIKEIRLFHIFSYGKLMNVYRFMNPKITNLTLDEVDMADNGNGNELEFQFVYDALRVEPNVDIEWTNDYIIQDLTGRPLGAQYYINPTFASDGGNNATGTKNAPSADHMNLLDQATDTVTAVTRAANSAIQTATGAVNDIVNTTKSAIQSATGVVSNVFNTAKTTISSFL